MTDRQALHEAGVTWDEDGASQGFQIGRSFAILEWRHKKEAEEFQRLVWRLQARKYWAAKNPESKARIQAYRRQWALAHPEQVQGYNAKAKARLRSNPAYREKEAATMRAKRAIATAERRANTVYTCAECGTRWSPVRRIPSRPPKYCAQPCKSRAAYRRARAAGKR